MILRWKVLGVILCILTAVLDSRLYAAQNVSEESEDTEESALSSSQLAGNFSLGFFSIFYGPAIKNPSSFQPTPSGEINFERPVLFKNLLTLGYGLSEQIMLSATGYWLWKPLNGQKVLFQDPFIKLSHLSLLHWNNVNLYGDIRFHLPASESSRQNDVRFGVETVLALTMEVPHTRLMLGTLGSTRMTRYGKFGMGNDLEVYLAPNLTYQLTPTLSLVVLYEMQASHGVGIPLSETYNDGTDIEPGLSWDVTPQLNIHPYLNIMTGDKISLRSTTVGLMVYWGIF